MDKKRTYPCAPATEKEIARAMSLVSVGLKVETLRQITHRITADQIPWTSVSHMGVIGSRYDRCNSGLVKAGLQSGVYTTHDGSGLILIHPDESSIQEYANRYSDALRTLRIYHIGLSTVSLSQLTQLTTLDLSGCDRLTWLTALDGLTQLTTLRLSGCNSLIELPPLDALTQLTTLRLSGCSSLIELPSLDALTQLTMLNLSGCSSLAELPPLDALTQLTVLNLSGCSSLAELPLLDALTQLTVLNLSEFSSLTKLPPLDALTQLTALNLSGCRSLAKLPPLDALTQLTALDLSGCSGLTELNLSGCNTLTELPPLDTLTQLTTLDLSGCRSLAELPPLDTLTQLTTLDLSGCSSLAELPPLDALIQLTALNLSGCRSLTRLPPLDTLTQLTTLDLSGCRSLTRLPPLDMLKQLTTLDLSGCRSLTWLAPLDMLKQLTTLDLSGCRSLTWLPPLDALKQLTTLNLSGCRSLTELPLLDTLTQLSTLNLSGCDSITELNLRKCSSLRELPAELRTMKSLRRLNLRGMQLQDLPDWLPEIAEGFSLDYGLADGENKAIVYLCDTTVEAIPDMSIFDQPYEVVAEFFRKRALGQTHPLNEIKVVFLGDGEAGKSHTIARLMNDGGEPVGYVDSSTPGIVIKDQKYTAGDRTFRVHYWDFGGQEIMHSMHRIFLTRRTMYVILLNARDDTQSERAKYWLHNVQSFAPDAPVLLVLNKIDQNPNASVDERDLRSRYSKLTQVVRLSAMNFTQEEFNECFTEVLLKEIQKTGFLDAQWPTAWTMVKEKLELESLYIMGSEYQSICQECHVDENRKNLLRWFNDLGVSFCYEDDGDEYYALDEYVILRPEWITNALYIILFNPLKGAQNGLVPHRAIYDLLKNASNNPDIHCTLPKATYDHRDIGYVLGIMRKFNISFTDGHKNEFIPMLCQRESKVEIQYYRKDADTLEFSMEFDYLPNNLLHRLMVERYSELDMEAVWRTGTRFHLKEIGYSAVVVIDGNTLRFFIRHTDSMHRPNTYLSMLKAHVDRIVAKMGLKAPTCKLVYKLDGKQEEFEYELMTEMMESGESNVYSRIQRKRIPIMGIMNQSAPDDLGDEKKLLDQIILACGNIQDEPSYRLIPNQDGRGYKNGRDMENLRNRRVRDNLRNAGYHIADQSQQGISGTGKSVGELDMLVFSNSNTPWTIIEALRVSGTDKSQWDKHLKKLSDNYNPRRFPALYLLVYVDADTTDFARIYDSYRDHIKIYHPGQLKYLDRSITELNVHRCQSIKVVKCHYSSGGDSIAVYHIFAQIPVENE